jgi:hypothetical protein
MRQPGLLQFGDKEEIKEEILLLSHNNVIERRIIDTAYEGARKERYNVDNEMNEEAQ